MKIYIAAVESKIEAAELISEKRRNATEKEQDIKRSQTIIQPRTEFCRRLKYILLKRLRTKENERQLIAIEEMKIFF